MNAPTLGVRVQVECGEWVLDLHATLGPAGVSGPADVRHMLASMVEVANYAIGVDDLDPL